MSDKLPEWPERDPLDLYALSQAALARMEALAATLTELRALVRGECPSLLDEDSGGDARLDLEIDDLLAACERRSRG